MLLFPLTIGNPTATLAEVHFRPTRQVSAAQQEQLPTSLALTLGRGVGNMIEKGYSWSGGVPGVSLAAAADPYMLDLSADARAFCLREHLLTYVKLAEGLIKKYFPSAAELRWEYEIARECEDQWMAAYFEVSGALEIAMDQYDALTTEWVARAPWPQSDRISFQFEVV